VDLTGKGQVLEIGVDEITGSRINHRKEGRHKERWLVGLIDGWMTGERA
jgi:hypothetical protein